MSVLSNLTVCKYAVSDVKLHDYSLLLFKRKSEIESWRGEVESFKKNVRDFFWGRGVLIR